MKKLLAIVITFVLAAAATTAQSNKSGNCERNNIGAV
jgi:hypothetical protein